MMYLSSSLCILEKCVCVSITNFTVAFAEHVFSRYMHFIIFPRKTLHFFFLCNYTIQSQSNDLIPRIHFFFDRKRACILFDLHSCYYTFVLPFFYGHLLVEMDDTQTGKTGIDVHA